MAEEVTPAQAPAASAAEVELSGAPARSLSQALKFVRLVDDAPSVRSSASATRQQICTATALAAICVVFVMVAAIASRASVSPPASSSLHVPGVPRLERWHSGLANIHIQKCGGTALYLNCVADCPQRRLLGESPEEQLAHGHDNASRERGAPCGCAPVFDTHWSFAELRSFGDALSAVNASIGLRLMTMLRNPIDRVISEFWYLTRTAPDALYQDHWDYLDRRVVSGKPAPRLSSAGLAILSGGADLNLSQFIELAPPELHPAHNRQARYVAGFTRAPYSTSPWCCLGRHGDAMEEWALAAGGKAAGNAVGGVLAELQAAAQDESRAGTLELYQTSEADARTACAHLRDHLVAFGLLERGGETEELFRYQLPDWPAGWRSHRGRSSAYNSSDLAGPALRARIAELNAHDVALYECATVLFEERLAAVRAAGSQQYRRAGAQ